MFKKILDNILLLRFLILILICFCGYYAIQFHIPSKLLSFRSFQSNSIIQNSNQLEITNNSNILLLVEGDEEDMKLFSKDIKIKLESFDNWISRVHIDFPIDFYKKNKFKLLDLNQLKDLASMLKDPNLIDFLKNLNQNIENNFLKKLDINQLEIYETEIFNILDSIEKFINYKKEFLYKSYFDDF